MEPGPLDLFQNLFHGTQLLKALLLTHLGRGRHTQKRVFSAETGWDLSPFAAMLVHG